MVLALALAGMALPSTAIAGIMDQAKAAVGAAKGKIEAGDKAGVSGEAADIQARARTAYETAQRQLDDDKYQAMYSAQEASALADLAMATAELKKLEGERAQVAAAN